MAVTHSRRGCPGAPGGAAALGEGDTVAAAAAPSPGAGAPCGPPPAGGLLMKLPLRRRGAPLRGPRVAVAGPVLVRVLGVIRRLLGLVVVLLSSINLCHAPAFTISYSKNPTNEVVAAVVSLTLLLLLTSLRVPSLLLPLSRPAARGFR